MRAYRRFFQHIAPLLLFYVVILNITCSQNEWTVSGVHLGQALFWLLIILSWGILSLTIFLKISTGFILFAFLFKFLEGLTSIDAFQNLRVLCLGLNFCLCSAYVFGENIRLLHKHMIVFWIFNLVIMIFQMHGIHSIFLGWNTEIASDPRFMSVEDVGTFRIALAHKTFLVQLKDLYVSVGQMRPSGLFHSNNVMSVFISFSLVINQVLKKEKRIQLTDFILIAVAVLSMSKLAVVVLLFISFSSLIFSYPLQRAYFIQSLSIVAVIMFVYYLMYPGLFLLNVSPEIMWSSFLLRFVDLGNSLGLDLSNLFYEQQQMVGRLYNSEFSYSFFGQLLKNKFFPLALFLIFLSFVFYIYSGMRAGIKNLGNYISVGAVLIFTQFAVPFVKAPSFQLLFGIACYPVIKFMFGERTNK